MVTSNLNKTKLTKFSKLFDQIRLNSLIGKVLRPVIELTCFKYKPLPSIYISTDKKYIVRSKYLINKLKSAVKEVPIILARKFNNACYISDMKKLTDKYGEDELKRFCDDIGADFKLVINNLCDHMIFVGLNYYSPEVIAHEIGHYLNTVNRGEVGGAEAHAKYSKRTSTISKISLLSLLTASLSIFAKKQQWKLVGLFSSAGLDATAALLSRPILIAEKTASITGLKLLKSFGLTDAEYNDMQASLNGAYNTYKSSYIYTPVTGAASKVVISALVSNNKNQG